MDLGLVDSKEEEVCYTHNNVFICVWAKRRA